jgi:ADP-heptose:LPS heptosyltransferase
MPTTPSPQPHQQEHVLLVRTSALGDVVQTWALAYWLRQQRPHWRISWLVGQAALPLVAYLPHVVDEVIPLPKMAKGLLPKLHTFRQALPLASAMASPTHPISISLDTQGLYKSAWWAQQARVPQRIGFAPPREAVAWAYTHTVGRLPSQQSVTPAVFEMSQLLLPLSCAPTHPSQLLPSVWPALPGNHVAWQQVATLTQHWPTDRPWVIISPTTTWASKHWPLQHWATLVAMLVQAGYWVIGLASAMDAPLLARVASQANLPAHPHESGGGWVAVSGELNLEGLFALLPQGHALVGQDSFLFHLADAYNRSALNDKTNTHQPLHLVGLFGPTTARRTGALWPQAVNLTNNQSCQPCHKRDCPLGHQACLAELDPLDVFKAVTAGLPCKPVVPI